MIRNILVPLDGSDQATCVLPHAIAFARAFQAQIILMQVLDRPRVGPADSLDRYLHEAATRAYLDSVKLHFETRDLPVETGLLEGNITEQLIEFAASGEADLVILSGRGEIMNQMVQKLPISTLIVRSTLPVDPRTGDLHYRRILVPLDGSERAGAVVTLASTLAQAHQAEIQVVHIVSTPEMASLLSVSRRDMDLASRIRDRNRDEGSQYLQEMLEGMPVGTKSQVLMSDTVATSLQTLVLEQQIDLVILSSHGSTDETRLPYGGVTGRLIEGGTVPLLIVRGLIHETASTRQMARKNEMSGIVDGTTLEVEDDPK